MNFDRRAALTFCISGAKISFGPFSSFSMLGKLLQPNRMREFKFKVPGRSHARKHKYLANANFRQARKVIVVCPDKYKIVHVRKKFTLNLSSSCILRDFVAMLCENQTIKRLAGLSQIRCFCFSSPVTFLLAAAALRSSRMSSFDRSALAPPVWTRPAP